MKEQQLVNGLIAYLRTNGHYVWRQNTGAMYNDKTGSYVRFGHKGVSDIIGVAKDGKMIAVECKVWPKKPTEFQKEFLKEVEERGGYAILAYKFEDVEGIL